MSGGIDAVTLSTANEGRPISDQGVFALGLLWLSGMCLRITVLALPPVIPFLHADLNLSETDVGWLSSLAPMLFALMAIPGAVLIARFGIVPALVIGLLINAIGSTARAAAAGSRLVSAPDRIRHGRLHQWAACRRNDCGGADHSAHSTAFRQ